MKDMNSKHVVVFESSAFQVKQEIVPKWLVTTWDSQEVQVFIGPSELFKLFCFILIFGNLMTQKSTYLLVAVWTLGGKTSPETL